MSAPIKKFSLGGVQLAVWENEATLEAGQTRTFKSATLERRYKDKKGEWKGTNSLKANDIPKAILALQKAYEYMVLKEPDLA